jgi:hypothetical protein
MKVSEEVRKLDGKEGNVTDIIKQYLDVKKVNYSVLKAEPGDNVARPKDIYPFVEPGSIMIEKNGKKVIIEELTRICGVSGRFHSSDEKVNANAILNRSQRIVFKTYKDKKNLHIHTNADIKDPSFGFYLGGGNITVDMEDILKEPSKMPDHDETFEINCNCEEGILKCKGRTWEW